METIPLISLEDICFNYGGSGVLNNLSLQLKRGQKVGISGENGAGKTTLFHIIMGLLKPVAGIIKIFDKLVEKQEHFVEVRKKIGFLFQDSDDQLFCPTVAEDIAFGPLNLGKTHQEAQNIVTETCRMLGLHGFEERITHKLSGGEKRLCALATIVAMEPEVFLLDEPTTGLDTKTINRLIDFLNNHSTSHIIISHNMEFLKTTTTEILYLKEGALTDIGR
ncbi:MAG: energy-coupling factor ABC transporter ATP-binding protein [Candidatus Magnetoovum sp. WYHC-5]|nr:energy-coupling factor ABC transporter ATP-binding protein [Candidatus Magnetoovum sp. WYHC-5]